MPALPYPLKGGGNVETTFTVVFKTGNTIDTTEMKAYTAKEALATWHENTEGRVLGIMPTEVFELLPDASVFFGIFPY